VGLFGGAFDPPHCMHRALAQAAIAQLDLDELRVMPTGRAWHKPRPLTPAPHRLAMCHLAFGDMPQIRLDDREICREGPSYTVDTLTELWREVPNARWFLLLGSDQWRAFTTWHRWPDILKGVTVVVAARPDSPVDGAVAPEEASAALPCITLTLPPSRLSSSAVREQLATRTAAELATSGLVPEAVARYISEHHLYQRST